MERFLLNIYLRSPDISQKLYFEAIVKCCTSLDFNHFISIVYYILKLEVYKLSNCRKKHYPWSELVVILRIDFSPPLGERLTSMVVHF